MISEIIQSPPPNRFIGLIPSVVKAADAKLPTKYGEFRIAGYRSLTSDEEFVVVYGASFVQRMLFPFVSTRSV
ncbi:MAG: hypothetical protein IPP63_18060 [Chloracidobacterium sp.]|nr:hypothetical protein [Chloracidobacterium sp.]